MISKLTSLADLLASKKLIASASEVFDLMKYADARSLARALRDAQALEDSLENSINYGVPGGTTEWTPELEESFRKWMSSVIRRGILPADKDVSSYYSDKNGDGKVTLDQRKLNSILNQPANQPRTTTVQKVTKELERRTRQTLSTNELSRGQGTDNSGRDLQSAEQRPEQASDSQQPRGQSASSNEKKYNDWIKRLNSGEFDAGRRLKDDQASAQAAQFAGSIGHDELAGEHGSMEDTSFTRNVLNA